MSLVSCVGSEMCFTLANSDTEDQLANIAQRLKAVTDQGAELGKFLANLDGRIDEIKLAYRSLDADIMNTMYSPHPNAQNRIAAAQQRKAVLSQQDCALKAQKDYMEAERRILAAQEREYLAEKTAVETKNKLSQGAMQQFKQMKTNAIQRFFGGQ